MKRKEKKRDYLKKTNKNSQMRKLKNKIKIGNK
jgi:hypothetical protein